MFYTEFVGDLFNLSGESHLRLTGGVIYYFDVRPGNPAAPAGSDQLENRFFRSEAAGQFLHMVLILFGISLLGGGKNPVDETLAVPLYHLFYSGTINQVYTVRYNFHLFIQIIP
jgi:hypothetical protein